MDDCVTEIQKDFENQIKTLQSEILTIEDQLNKKREHLLKLQGGLETLSILEQKISSSINIDD
jgi:hypothetical protein